MMRLRAIRVKDVGCFDQPVALEGLSDGLNVLSGRNELGKSTLLKALRAAFEKKHTSTDETIGELQPYRSGAPLIEVDFDTDEGSWRLRKQFMAGKSAELIDRHSGKAWRNNDVQGRLDDLLRRGPDQLNRFSILWVEQGDPQVLEAKKPKAKKDADDQALAGHLSQLVADEVDTLSMDAVSRRVHQDVQQRLQELQTSSGGRKKNGPWQLAFDAVEAQAADLAVVAGRADLQAARLEQLGTLVAERVRLTGEDGIAALVHRRDEAARRLEQALAATRSAEAARKTFETRRAELTLAERTMTALTKTDDEIATLEAALAKSAADLQDLAARETELVAERAAADARVVATRKAVEDLQAAHGDARRVEAAMAANANYQRLATTLAEARSAMSDRDAADAELAQLAPVTPELIAALDAAMEERVRWDARFEGLAPQITFALEPGAAGQVRVDGRPLTADVVLNPDRPLEIEIAGIGRIRIAPNPAIANEAAAAQRRAAHARATALFAQAGTVDAATAKTILARRELAARTRQSAHARVATLAPEGLDALTATLAAHASAASPVAAPPRSSGEIEAALLAARAAARDAEEALRHAVAAAAGRDQTRVMHQSTQRAHTERLGVLRACPAAEATLERQSAMAALAQAKTAFTEADVAHQTWREANAGLDPLTAEQAVKVTTDSLTTAQERQAKVNLDIKGIEGALEVANSDDIEAEHRRRTEALVEARLKLADIEAERAALVLLDAEFEALAAGGREQISAPVRARIMPYLARVLPGAVLDLDTGFAPRSLLRAGATETLERLSQGTREQIAIVTRLGLGKLLAERQAAVPLILDDALVFADDDRIEAMFDALSTAAKDHQVIVFTCRTRSFAGLIARPGTTTLQLQPWLLQSERALAQAPAA